MTSSTETLLTHATWLRRLAATLAHDPDDLVQETYLAALRHPPATDRPVRPWLVRVLRNAARFRWRSDANRAAREQAVDVDAAAPSSEELLARHELQQLLARLVGELAEPFRTTILLRFAEGLTPAEIAKRLGVPGGTVRWRLKEALERLRYGLDRAHGGERKKWVLVCLPFAGALGAAAASVFAFARWPIAVLAFACIAITIAIVATRRGGSNDDAPTRPAHPEAVTTPPPPIPPLAAGWAAQEGAPNRHLTGRVIFAGAPVAGAQVRMTAEAMPAIEARTDDDGRFDLGEQPAHEIAIGASAPDRLAPIRRLDLRDPTASTDVDLELLPCPARLEGHVIDAGGNPIAHARVLREDVIGTETGSDGAYSLCALPTAALTRQLEVVVRADGYGAVVTGIALDGLVRRDFSLVPEATITGTATAGAEVWIEPDRDDTRPTSERAARLATAADASGHFHFAGVAPGPFRIGAAGRGTTAIVGRIRADAGAAVDVTLAMMPAAIVHGVVRSRGQPVASARIAVATGTVAIRHDDPGHDPIIAGDAITQADGTFVLDGLPPGATTLTALPMRVRGQPITLTAGDNRVELDTDPLGRIRGVVRRHGVPVPYARVDFGSASRKGGLTTDAGGRYEIDGLEPGRYTFYADDLQRHARVGSDGFVLADGETRDFDLELAWGGEIRGVVVDGAGAPVRGVHVRFTADTDEQCRGATDAAGAFTCAMIERGTFVPTVHPGDDTTRPFPFVVPPAPVVVADGDSIVNDVRLVIDPRVATIAGTVVDDTGAPVADARIQGVGSDLVQRDWFAVVTTSTDAAGHFVLERLAPGAYDVSVTTSDGALQARHVFTTGTTDATISIAPWSCPRELHEPAAHPASPVVWDDRIELVGWDLPPSAHRNQAIDVVLVFRVRAPIAHTWDVFAHFNGGAKHWANADHHAPCPSSSWRAGDVIVDRFTATVDTPGHYTLHVGFYRHDGDGPWENLALAGGTDDGAVLGTIDVDSPP